MRRGIMKLLKFFIVLLLGTSFTHVIANEKIALVIGNTDYEVSPLRTAVNDATAFSQALSEIGFQVDLQTNTNQQEMEAAVQSFGRSIQSGAIGLFYYAGHAVQHNGENYLVPVNAISSITAPEHLRYKTVPLGYVLGVVNQSASDLNVVILDSCRNSPFKSFSRDLTRGITRMPSSEGTLIAYSTAPGKVALDGRENDQHSPYTKSLLKHIKQPGLTIEQVLKKVRASVKKETNGQQTPWYEASIDGDFYFIKDEGSGTKKVIKVATVEPPKKVITPEKEKKVIKQETLESTKQLSYIDVEGANEGKRLNAAQTKQLVIGNTLYPTSGSFKGAHIYVDHDGRAYYHFITKGERVIEGITSWTFTGAKFCIDLHKMGTNANLSEKEVCYRFIKQANQEYKLQITQIKLFSYHRESPVGKYIFTKVMKGREGV